MGLLLSVLVGCVGVLELLVCMRRAVDGVIVTVNPPTPCLSYHDENDDNRSIHDSLCSFSHSDMKLPRGARHKLENLHEYSLRVRTELRFHDKNFDCGTLSECSTRDLFSRPDSRQSGSRPDSRLSPDFSLPRDEEEARWEEEYDEEEYEYEDDYEEEDEEEEDRRFMKESRTTSKADEKSADVKKYVRVPTPIPFGIDDGRSRSGSSSDVSSFENESGNEAPTTKSFGNVPVIKRYEDLSPDETFGSSAHRVSLRKPRKSPSKSPSKSPIDPSLRRKSPEISVKFQDDVTNITSILKSKSAENIQIRDGLTRSDSPIEATKKRSSKTTSILRKATRLKSRNAEVSKSAENLSARKSKRSREPERRKSDISVQTSLFRDESTNTSPPGSPASLSRSESKRSVSSLGVQTSFEEKLSEDEEGLVEFGGSAVGLSESKRDLSARERFGRKSFKSKRFRSRGKEDGNGEEEDAISMTNATEAVEAMEALERPRREEKFAKVSSFEEAEKDDYRRYNVIFEPSPNNGRTTLQETGRTRKERSSEEDEEFVDARGPVERPPPDTNKEKAFWLIFSGEYTKAMNKDWHSGHFCCWQCDESLTGQRYVLRDEHPYCIKCYESVFANGCEECNKIIGIDSKDLSYKDKHWHEACFLCNKCRVSLVDKQFGSKVDKIYCGNCYDAQFASRCDGCGEIFRAGTKKMEYKTRQWHEKCFCCVVCRNPIGTKTFIPREQEIYCAGCYEDKFATRCVKCNKIITSGGVTYKNEPWHRDCFTCSNCNTSLAGQRFTSRDEKPYCAECFGELFAKRCTACSKPITGIGGTRFISFEDRHWHNDCFICAGCKTSLVGRGFITDGDDIICPECAKMKLM